MLCHHCLNIKFARLQSERSKHVRFVTVETALVERGFWFVYNGNLEAWGERNNNLYLTNRKLPEFVGGKVNFLSILPVRSGTAKNRLSLMFMFTYVMIGIVERCLHVAFHVLYLISSQWISDLHYWRNRISGQLQKLVCSLLYDCNSFK